MSDVTCRICGEPWNTWGVQTDKGDLSHDEYRTLIRGEGCPHCEGFPLCANCGHTWRGHSKQVYGPGGGPCSEINYCYGIDPYQCECAAYVPRRAHDNEHYGSIEGEDSEAWEVLS